MSATGVLITAGRVLSPGWQVEIEVDWPAERMEGVSQKLVIVGKVVTSEAAAVAKAWCQDLPLQVQYSSGACSRGLYGGSRALGTG